MEALTAAVIATGLVVALERWMRHRLAQEAQRHAWRLELQRARATAATVEDAAKLEERVRRLELKGVTR